MKDRFFKTFPHSKHFAAKSVKYQEHQFKDQSQLKKYIFLLNNFLEIYFQIFIFIQIFEGNLSIALT